MADLIEQLRELISGLDAEVAQLQAEREGLTVAMRIAEKRQGTTAPMPSVASPMTKSKTTKSPKNKSGKKPGKKTVPFFQRIIGVMQAKGEPLRCKEILAVLTSEGVAVGGTDPARNISAHISRKRDRFKRMGDGRWGLVEWDNPTLPGALE